MGEKWISEKSPDRIIFKNDTVSFSNDTMIILILILQTLIQISMLPGTFTALIPPWLARAPQSPLHPSPPDSRPRPSSGAIGQGVSVHPATDRSILIINWPTSPNCSSNKVSWEFLYLRITLLSYLIWILTNIPTYPDCKFIKVSWGCLTVKPESKSPIPCPQILSPDQI